MEIRDPVHGAIRIDAQERRVIDHPLMQRLRRIKQLGFGDLAFPGATHTRFLHSLGVMKVASDFFDTLMKDVKIPDNHKKRFRQTVRLAGLLHDLGHPPLSHTSEAALAPLQSLNLPEPFVRDHTKTTHEDMTVKCILHSSLKDLIMATGVEPAAVAAVIQGVDYPERGFVVDGVDYLPMLHQIISSEMDADRMDYLLRDSFFTGASYGSVDIGWLVSNLKPVRLQNRYHLGLDSRAVFAFEDFLLSRYHMFLMVYFHHKSVIMHRMLAHFFDAHVIEFPGDPDEYLFWDDRRLLDLIAKQDDPWAQRITNADPLKTVMEFRGPRPKVDMEKIAEYWRSQGAVVEVVDSRFELSNYYSTTKHDPAVPAMFIVEGSRPMALQDYTDLFERYSRERHIIRIYSDQGHRKAIQEYLMDLT